MELTLVVNVTVKDYYYQTTGYVTLSKKFSLPHDYIPAFLKFHEVTCLVKRTEYDLVTNEYLVDCSADCSQKTLEKLIDKHGFLELARC